MINAERRRNRLFSGGSNGRLYTVIFMSRTNDENSALYSVRIVEFLWIQSVMTHLARLGLFATPRKLLIKVIGSLLKYRRLYRCQTLNDGKRYSFVQSRSYFQE